MMLEEFSVVTSPNLPRALTCASARSLRAIFTDRPTSSGRTTFANTLPTCSATRNSPTIRSIKLLELWRLFFVKMLKRPWGVEETPYPKKRMRLPVILSRDEVARLI
jgi:hypothetical protein